jgi:hypothetical protein
VIQEINWPTGDETVAQVAKLTDTILLSLSRGKDSVAMWVACRPYFKRIVPIHMSYLPGLHFVEDYLDYLEDKLGSKIVRMMHNNTITALREFIYQPPERWPLLDALDSHWPRFYWFDKARVALKQQLDLPEHAWGGFGIRTEDSMLRGFVLNKYGPLNFERHEFKPIWDWPLARVLSTIRDAGIKLAVDYKFMDRSWENFDYKYLVNIERFFPEDFARIKKIFPMVEAEFARHEFAVQHRAVGLSGQAVREGSR